MREPGPYLLNVQVSPYENVYPMVPAGGAINEMVLGPPQPVEAVRRMLQVISLLLENKPGALMRVTGLLSARGYNIESLTVARTLDPELSRMTIVVDVDPQLRAQVIKQMNKLINVLQASDLTDSPAVRRELVLLRVARRMRPHGDSERSRDFRRAGGGFLHRRICPRSHRRSRKTGRIYRRDAQLRRNRGHPLGHGGDVAGSQEAASGAAGTQVGAE